MCSTKTQVHIARRIITLQEVTWVTDGGMFYRIAENELYNSLENVQNGALFPTLTALKTNILTFYCKVCSSLSYAQKVKDHYEKTGA